MALRGQRDNGVLPFTSGQQRIWVHPDPKPTSRILDFGLTELGKLADTSPDPEDILVPNRRYFNHWDTVGAVLQPDERQSVDFTTTANGAGRSDWLAIKKNQIPFIIYNTVGAPREGNSVQADDAHTWTMKGVAYNGVVTAVSPFGESINSKSENAESLATGSISYKGVQISQPTEFTKVGGATFTRGIVSLDTLRRGSYYEVFGLTTNTAATAPSAVIYGRTDSSTYTQTNVTALSTDGLADNCIVVGNALLLLRSTGTESHLYASLDAVRSGTSAFTAVTSGYVSTKGAVAGYTVSAGNTVLVGLGGYIYSLYDVTAAPVVVSAGTLTTQDLADVRGFNGQLIAGGAANALVISNDGGYTWATLAAPAGQSGENITTVEVVAENQFYLGYGDGTVWYGDYNESTGAAVWTQLSLFGGGTPTVIGKIRFVNKVFGYISGNDANTGLLWKTSSAGVRISGTTPEIARFSSAYSTGDTAPAIGLVDENSVYVGGLATAAGILVYGE